ncbi:MAG: hypothetical protein KDD51_13980 [Bdellovibrionales bacterium]|nr:hypothetical protein [Bdellovibrionales bacterium]
MMPKIFFLFCVLAGTVLGASELELVSHFGGGRVYLRRGSDWYAGATVWSLKRDPGLAHLKQIQVGADLCAWTNENEVRCWDSQVHPSAVGKGRSLGAVPELTKHFHGYCLETKAAEIFCLQSFIDGNELKYRYEKVDTKALGTIAAVSASATHICVQNARGKIFCWGENYGGKLGTGGYPFFQRPEEGGDWSVTYATAGIPFPTREIESYGKTFAGVSVYANTSCALSDELKNNVYCWGRLLDTSNLYMEFQLFSQTTSSIPRGVDLSAVPAGRVDGIVAGPLVGFGHDEVGRIYFWGEYGTPPATSQRLAFKAQAMAEVPAGFSIRKLVPVQGEVCAIGAFEGQAEQMYCTRRPWDNPAGRPEMVGVTLP